MIEMIHWTLLYWLTFVRSIQLISLLQLMSIDNIQEEHATQLLAENPPTIKYNEELLEEICNLKKVVSALT